MPLPYAVVGPQRLDAYGQWAAERILSQHPTWLIFSSITAEKSLLIVVPWPLNPFKELVITTVRGETTIFVGPWHFHFSEEYANDNLTDALYMLGQIVKEEIGFVVVSGHQGRSFFSEKGVEEIRGDIKLSYRSSMYSKSKLDIYVDKYFWIKPPEHTEFHK